MGDKRAISILLLLNNMTAIAFLDRMGGTHSAHLCNLAVEVWKWCLDREIVIHSKHLPGSENIRADWNSQHVADSSDWFPPFALIHRCLSKLKEERAAGVLIAPVWSNQV